MRTVEKEDGDDEGKADKITGSGRKSSYSAVWDVTEGGEILGSDESSEGGDGDDRERFHFVVAVVVISRGEIDVSERRKKKAFEKCSRRRSGAG